MLGFGLGARVRVNILCPFQCGVADVCVLQSAVLFAVEFF